MIYLTFAETWETIFWHALVSLGCFLFIHVMMVRGANTGSLTTPAILTNAFVAGFLAELFWQFWPCPCATHCRYPDDEPIDCVTTTTPES